MELIKTQTYSKGGVKRKRIDPKKNKSGKGMVMTTAKVNRLINSKLESKCASFDFQARTLYVYPGNTVNWGTNNVYPLTPNSASYMTIVQGTSQGTRIGNTINTVKGTINMVFYPALYDATTNPIPEPMEMRFLVLKIKDQSRTMDGIAASDFFQNGVSSVPLSGRLEDMIAEVNTDVFVVYADFIRKQGAASNTGTGLDANRMNYANNDYKYNVMVKRTFTPPVLAKKISFNDNTALPYSAQTYLVILLASASNTNTYHTTGRVPMLGELHYNYRYQDA